MSCAYATACREHIFVYRSWCTAHNQNARDRERLVCVLLCYARESQRSTALQRAMLIHQVDALRMHAHAHALQTYTSTGRSARVISKLTGWLLLLLLAC